MLTPKREKFVQNLIKGMSQRDAYRLAFPSSKKWKDNVVDSKASELSKNGEILERYNELLSRLENKAIMSAQERMIWLTKVVNCDVKVKQEFDNEIREYEPYMSDRLKALDILNKMDGVYTQRLEVIETPSISDDIDEQC